MVTLYDSMDDSAESQGQAARLDRLLAVAPRRQVDVVVWLMGRVSRA